MAGRFKGDVDSSWAIEFEVVFSTFSGQLHSGGQFGSSHLQRLSVVSMNMFVVSVG